MWLCWTFDVRVSAFDLALMSVHFPLGGGGGGGEESRHSEGNTVRRDCDRSER